MLRCVSCLVCECVYVCLSAVSAVCILGLVRRSLVGVDGRGVAAEEVVVD